MRKLLLILAAFSAPFAIVPAAAAAERPPLSLAEKEGIALALQRGQMIYAYDRAAWRGTDDMLTKLPDPSARIGGWLVDGPADAPHLVFFDKDPAQPHIVYSADFRDGKVVAGHVLAATEDRSLSPSRKALADAVNAARRALADGKPMRCADKPFNTVVLPPARPGEPVLVYFLTPQTRDKSWPMGGHYVVEVAADGKAGVPRPFTRSCLEMDERSPGKDKVAAMVVSHLLGPTPTELHVFTSLASGLPIFVMTVQNKRLWQVNRNTIMEIPNPGR